MNLNNLIHTFHMICFHPVTGMFRGGVRAGPACLLFSNNHMFLFDSHHSKKWPACSIITFPCEIGLM